MYSEPINISQEIVNLRKAKKITSRVRSGNKREHNRK